MPCWWFGPWLRNGYRLSLNDYLAGLARMTLYIRFLTLGLAAFWLLLSGFWDNSLLLLLGVVSVVLSIWLAMRIERHYPLYSVTRMFFRFPPYWGWMMGEIVKCNLDVSKSIWMPKRFPISPVLDKVPMTQKTRLGKTVYANSITLTPGTVSVRFEQEKYLWVHALTQASMDDLKAGGMDSRVTDLEDKD